MDLPVKGSVRISADGSAQLQLRTVIPRTEATSDLKPPSAQELIAAIYAGTLPIHPSRANVTISELKIMVSNAQFQSGLATGPNGGWNSEAMDIVKRLLFTQKRVRRSRTTAAPPARSVAMRYEPTAPSRVMGSRQCGVGASRG